MLRTLPRKCFIINTQFSPSASVPKSLDLGSKLKIILFLIERVSKSRIRFCRRLFRVSVLISRSSKSSTICSRDVTFSLRSPFKRISALTLTVQCFNFHLLCPPLWYVAVSKGFQGYNLVFPPMLFYLLVFLSAIFFGFPILFTEEHSYTI